MICILHRLSQAPTQPKTPLDLPKTPLNLYIKAMQGEEVSGTRMEEFNKLSAAQKQQYKAGALTSLEQYQEVPCCTLSAPQLLYDLTNHPLHPLHPLHPAVSPCLRSSLFVPSFPQPSALMASACPVCIP